MPSHRDSHANGEIDLFANLAREITALSEGNLASQPPGLNKRHIRAIHLSAIREAYMRLPAQKKSLVLDSLCRALKIHRKHAIRLLSRRIRASVGGLTLPAIIRAEAIRIVRRLVALLAPQSLREARKLASLWAHSLNAPDSEHSFAAAKKAASMSQSTIGRILQTRPADSAYAPLPDAIKRIQRLKNPLNLLSAHGCGIVFVKEVTIHTADRGDLAGILVQDMHSRWTECSLISNGVHRSLAATLRRLPFPVRALHAEGSQDFRIRTRELAWSLPVPVPFSSADTESDQLCLPELSISPAFLEILNYGCVRAPSGADLMTPAEYVDLVSPSENHSKRKIRIERTLGEKADNLIERLRRTQ